VAVGGGVFDRVAGPTAGGDCRSVVAVGGGVFDRATVLAIASNCRPVVPDVPAGGGVPDGSAGAAIPAVAQGGCSASCGGASHAGAAGEVTQSAGEGRRKFRNDALRHPRKCDVENARREGATASAANGPTTFGLGTPTAVFGPPRVACSGDGSRDASAVSHSGAMLAAAAVGRASGDGLTRL